MPQTPPPSSPHAPTSSLVSHPSNRSGPLTRPRRQLPAFSPSTKWWRRNVRETNPEPGCIGESRPGNLTCHLRYERCRCETCANAALSAACALVSNGPMPSRSRPTGTPTLPSPARFADTTAPCQPPNWGFDVLACDGTCQTRVFTVKSNALAGMPYCPPTASAVSTLHWIRTRMS